VAALGGSQQAGRTGRARGVEPAKAAKGEVAAAKVIDRTAGATAPAEVAAAKVTDGAANEALPFIEFVGAHPVGSKVQAQVEQFSSHGAYVRIGQVQAYVALKYLAEPAPRSAKKILNLGETRSFVVIAVDPARRGVDLALPGLEPPDLVPAPEKKQAARRAKAKAKAPAKKAAARK